MSKIWSQQRRQRWAKTNIKKCIKNNILKLHEFLFRKLRMTKTEPKCWHKETSWISLRQADSNKRKWKNLNEKSLISTNKPKLVHGSASQIFFQKEILLLLQPRGKTLLSTIAHKIFKYVQKWMICCTFCNSISSFGKQNKI